MAHRWSSIPLTRLMGCGSWPLRCPAVGMGKVGQASAGPGGAEGEPHGVGGTAVIAWSGGGDQVAAWWNRVVELGFSLGGGDPHQEVGGPLGGGVGEVVVASEGGDEVADGLLVAVAFQEEAEHRVVFSPVAEPVHLDEPAPGGLAALLGPPQGQLDVGVVAGVAGQGGEEPVDPKNVGQAAAVGDRERGGASVAEVGHSDALFGGQDSGAGRAEDVVVGGRASVVAGLEAVPRSARGGWARPSR